MAAPAPAPEQEMAALVPIAIPVPVPDPAPEQEVAVLVSGPIAVPGPDPAPEQEVAALVPVPVPVASGYGLSASSVDKRKGSPCRQDGDGRSHANKIIRYSIPDLPEDVWCHIHSLMPLRDAARVACLSHAFLHSWRCHPNLTLNKDVLRSKAHGRKENLSDIIDRILNKHSGIGVKILKLELDGISCRCLDIWLRIAVKPGIEVFILRLRRSKIKYNLPCSLLSDGVTNSIQYLELGFCAFRPTVELGPLRSLRSLHLHTVHITGDELECLLSNARALEKLILDDCKEIIYLKIPCVLKKLNYLSVFGCGRLQVLESKAPNLSSFFLSGKLLKLSLGDTMQMKNLAMFRPNIVCYARAELSSTMPNLETLVLHSDEEVVNTPMLPTKFLYLKHLTIRLVSGLTFSPSYDYFSLVSFIDASPSLETLDLDVCQPYMKHESVFGDSTHLRQIPEHRHFYLKNVKIIGFSSAKGLVELACYIIKNAVSLEVSDIRHPFMVRGVTEKLIQRVSLRVTVLMEAPRAITAIRTYIEDKVPSTVKLTVLEPCTRCHVRAACP